MVKKRTLGFTLIEMMVVIAVIAVLSAIAVPSFMEYARNQRLNGAARQVYTDLMNARQQAVTENKKIIVQFVNNHQYQFVRDNDASETVTTGDETLVLRDIQPEYSDVTFSAGFNPAFRPNGTGKNPVITLTSSSTGKTKCITISTAGRIKIGDCS
ncbi:MAG: Fimbrial protein precursor [Deltaproteobacteria bacterium ADurb.Bin022]|jgi:type IV fimbrial biogenesis protein FimT|nr:MAG: Fimbrial protein precursor [Deltaproteobacteria bacterium ADurb.Bin022]